MKMFRETPNLTVNQTQRAAVLRSSYHRVLLTVGLAIAVFLPFALSPYHVHIVNLALIAAIGALALNMLTGLSGQVSLGHAAFLAIGAFAVVVVERAGAGIFVALPLAAAAGGFVGLIVGIPATRFRGIYLAVCTLAMHYAIVFLAKWYQARLGASASEGVSIADPRIFGYELSDDRHWYGVLLVFVTFLVWVFFNVLRSRAGRAWIAIRERDVSAEALGVNLFRSKLAAFVVSSAIVSVSGALLSYYTNSVSADTYTIEMAVAYLAMIIIGGMGSPIGAILGAFFITFLPYLVESAFSFAPVSWKMGGALFAYQLGAVGVFILLFVIFEPRGLIEIWRRIETYFDRWPFRYKALQLARK